MKATERWYSSRLGQDIGLARWGHYGTPVLVFPTAGGDAEEIERNHLVSACQGLIDDGRVKIYSCDSVAGRAILAQEGDPAHRMWLLDAFHRCVAEEIVPAIHTDLGGARLPVVVAGASIGAFNALAVLCRFPQLFSLAVCMSGTYWVDKFIPGDYTDDLYYASPMDFLPGLEGPVLDELRRRFVLFTSGQGAWEDVGESWAAADVLGRKGIPNRVDAWGGEWDHEWTTWWRMLPQYLDEFVRSGEPGNGG